MIGEATIDMNGLRPPMTDLQALEAAVLANPEDDAPRLILADYVEERGDVDYGSWLRAPNARGLVRSYCKGSPFKWIKDRSLRGWISFNATIAKAMKECGEAVLKYGLTRTPKVNDADYLSGSLP